MEQWKIPAKPGDALINANECFPDIELLCRDFDILYFLDLCAGLESAVLHNTLFTVGSLPSPATNPVVATLLKTETLQLYQITSSDTIKTTETIMQHPRAKSLLALGQRSIPEEKKDIYLHLIATTSSMVFDVVLEEVLQIPIVLSAHSTPVYLLLPDLQQEQAAFYSFQMSLQSTYSEFRKILYKIRKEFDKEVEGYDFFPFPPIALEALSKCERLEAIGDVILDMREAYANVRSQFVELQEIMRSPDKTLKEKQIAKKKILLSTKKLFRPDELDGITMMTSFAKELNDITKIEGFFDGADISDINWPKLVGYLIKKGESAYWKFRFRPLHATKRAYLEETSVRRIYGIVKHLFRHEITKEDVNKVCSYAQEVENLKIKMNQTKS